MAETLDLEIIADNSALQHGRFTPQFLRIAPGFILQYCHTTEAENDFVPAFLVRIQQTGCENSTEISFARSRNHRSLRMEGSAMCGERKSDWNGTLPSTPSSELKRHRTQSISHSISVHLQTQKIPFVGSPAATKTFEGSHASP